MQIRRLTRRTTDGRAYTRSSKVEAQITEALALDCPELRRRAAIADSKSPEHIKEEALVYLLRERHRISDLEMSNVLAEALLQRCIPQARKYLGALGDEQFEVAFAELIGELSELILDLDSDRGDFLQV